MPEYRAWVSFYGETRWVVLTAGSEEEAWKQARSKYGKRLRTLRPIVKARERQV